MKTMSIHGYGRVIACLLSILAIVALMFTSFETVPTLAAHVPPGGAPMKAQGNGTVVTATMVRAIDGRTVDTLINGEQVTIGLIGIDALPGNTPCGRQATQYLQSLVKGGLRLEEDASSTFDGQNRRMYSAVNQSGQPIAREMVSAGMARASTIGDRQHLFPTEEATARANQAGCIWGSGNVAAPLSPRAQGTSRAATTTSLPGNFTEQVVVTDYNSLTGFTFLPDGRILFLEKPGVVRVIKNSTLLDAPLINLTSRVNDYYDHGLLGIAADPNFATNGYIYLLYTYENNVSDYTGHKTARLARYTVVGDTASINTEFVLLGHQVGTSCNNFAKGADCLVSDDFSHSVGSLRFASDGTLFVTIGDGASFNVVDDNALRAQDLDLLAGKALHITTTGAGVPSNPFWTGDANANRSKVWVYGLRNPFRFTLRPGSDTPFIGDVGWSTWEEINVGTKGANLGWPCYEGEAHQDGYAPKATCQSLYSQGRGAVKFGLVTWGHVMNGVQVSAAAVGGTFYNRTAFPAAYRGAFFYADWGQSIIRVLTVDANNVLTSGPTDFATSADGPVDFQTGPDGSLYYMAINAGQLRRVIYGQQTAKVVADKTSGLSPLTVQFSPSADTVDPLGGSLQYAWNFGDTTTSTAMNPSHTYTTNGIYVTTLTTTNTHGGTASSSLTIVVGGGGCPTGQFFAEYFGNQNLSGSPSFAQCEAGINYAWGIGGPGHSIGLDHYSVRWSGQFNFPGGTYVFSASASDGMRVYLDGTALIDQWHTQVPAATYSAPTTITAGLHTVRVEYYKDAYSSVAKLSWAVRPPPTVTINSPASTLTYKIGDTINLSGAATDSQDGAISSTNLTWQAVIHHCPGGNCHTHFFALPPGQGTGPTASFTVPDHGDSSYFEVSLTATNSVGQTSTTSVTIHPQTIALTLNTNPGGIPVVYDGTAYIAPAVVTTIVGSLHTINTKPMPGQTFVSWSDGGAAQHDITISTTNTTITGTFSIPTVTPTPTPTATPNAFPTSHPNGRGASSGSNTPVPIPATHPSIGTASGTLGTTPMPNVQPPHH